MLEHMVVVDCLQCILAGMDVRAIVREITLEDERARISVAISRSMIRARVSALGQNVADVTVLSGVSSMSLSILALNGRMRTHSINDLGNERGEALVNVISDHAYNLWLSLVCRSLRVACHILLQHSLCILSFGFILFPDVDRSQEASFFRCVP